MVTGEQVKAAVLAAKLRKIPHHECSICGVMVFYKIRGEQLFFDSGCGCSEGSFELRTWDEAAQFINMQDDEKVRAEIMASFGMQIKQEAKS